MHTVRAGNNSSFNARSAALAKTQIGRGAYKDCQEEKAWEEYSTNAQGSSADAKLYQRGERDDIFDIPNSDIGTCLQNHIESAQIN